MFTNIREGPSEPAPGSFVGFLMRDALLGVSLALAWVCAGCDATDRPADVRPSDTAGDRTGVPRAAPAPTPPFDAAVGTDAFERLPPPSPGDWRSSFPGDVAMDFDEYRDSEPVRAGGRRRRIAFLPAGEFTDAERRSLDAATELTGIWFDLPTTALDPVPLTDDARQWRGESGPRRQIHTRWFLYSLLPDRVPDDAVVLLGVTMADLWPGRGWNFVFGQADLRRRIGVYSLARYFPSFVGRPDTPETDRLALLRTLKVVVHEAGHTFGLEHCTTWACNMNGSNSLAETDESPLHLCPDCMRKLAWNRGLDVPARHERLAAALDRLGLEGPASWHRRRAASLR